MSKTAATLLTLLAVLVGRQSVGDELRIAVEEYQDKVYASWLAQCIGNIYGLPHENDYIDEPGPEEFPYGYRASANKLKELNGAFSDDDTDIEYMYLLAMEEKGPEPTYADLAERWKYHVRDRVWLANRAAVGAMHYGLTPPVTGMKETNPHWFQIDPQLINEIWAVTAPGMVAYAAKKSTWAGRIMTDDWGTEPTAHYAAMYAAAFFESDVNKLIDIGNAALPEGARFRQTAEEMKRLYRKYPEDWRQARKEMAQKYYHEEPVVTKTIWNANLNGACGILALLYGEGDFQKTLDLSCAMGFDADNQAATMAGLLGVVYGMEGLPKNLLFPFPELGWKEPFNDVYKNISRHDMPDASLRDMAARMARQGEKITLEHGGRRIREKGKEYYVINSEATFQAPFEFPRAPMPNIEVGKELETRVHFSGAEDGLKWSVVKGRLPDGIRLEGGLLSGVATSPGVYGVELKVEGEKEQTTGPFRLVVRGSNLAPAATRVLANVKTTDTKTRDAMWLTVARSLYSDRLEDIIRDGRVTGDGSTFYSIDSDGKPKKDYYGYEWSQKQTIGLVGYHTGSMEENGGWFTSLNVEYRDGNGSWVPVKDLVVSPSLVPGERPHNKPHFVEYLLAFRPIQTTAIRLIGDAGGSRHWYSKPAYFTSISELSVHGELPGFERLAAWGDKRPGGKRVGYYIDSRVGSDDSPGTREAPWKTLTRLKDRQFSPGDTVYFARGSSFHGGFLVSSSGTADKPITFTAYGKGPAPRFANLSYDGLNGNMIQIRGSHVLVDGLYFHDGVPANRRRGVGAREIGAVCISLGADHNVVKNCEIRNCPVGIQVYGQYSLITRNEIHDCNMFLSYPSWGPVGIMVATSNNEISYNRIRNYSAKGGRFGADGGAMEIDNRAYPKENIRIHHNYSVGNEGFLEIIGDTPSTRDIHIAYNVSDDFQQFIFFWSGTDCIVEDNTVLCLKPSNSRVRVVFSFQEGGVTVRNNIFVLANDLQVFAGDNVYQATHWDQPHDHNLYHSLDGSQADPCGKPLGEGDIVADPLFVDLGNRDLRLQAGSPAVDAAKDVGAHLDFSDKPVPVGSAPDMGAYEYQVY